MVPLLACFYVHRAEHALWAMLISLLFVTPSAILAWQGSRLDPRIPWDLGGSPAAFAVQGAFAYAAYWLVMRQLGVIAQIDATLDLPVRALTTTPTLDNLGQVLSDLDTSLAAGLAWSQLGVVFAVHIGHRIIAAIEPAQQRSGLGWTLTFLLLGIIALFSSGMSQQTLNELPKVIDLIRAAAG